MFNYIKRMKKSEFGRTMIEILAVLVIVGILSIGGIWGYKKAVEMNEANEIVYELSQRAILLSSMKKEGTTPSLNEFQNTSFTKKYNVTYEDKGNGFFSLKMENLSDDVIRALKKTDWNMPYNIYINGVHIKDYDIDEKREKVSFLMSVFIKTAYADSGNTAEFTFPDDLNPETQPDYIDEEECIVSEGEWDGERCFCPEGAAMTSGGCITKCGNDSGIPCPEETICYRDSDCRGCLEICENGRCVINEKDPCNGKEFCDGNKRVACVKHGAKPKCQTHREEDDCTAYGSDYICSEEGGKTKCVQDSECNIGETACFYDSVYQCNNNGIWEPFELCTGACGYCVDGACSKCGEDMVCVNGSCMPMEIIYLCPIDWENEEDDDFDSSSGGSGGSSDGSGSGSGGTSGGSGGSSGATKTVYLSSDDPRCKKKCNDADCPCGCADDGINCKIPTMVYSGKCCTEGPVACCPDKEDCSPCQKAEDCTDCPEGKEEGEKWCSSTTTVSLCSNGSITHEKCPENTGCKDGECVDLCAERTEPCECGCDSTTGNCIEPIQKVTGDCCDQITSETCCPDDEACKCEPTANCKCTCDPSCQPGELCITTTIIGKDGNSTSCQCKKGEYCLSKEGLPDICEEEYCHRCENGECVSTCTENQVCEKGSCVGCNGCCKGPECSETCEPTPATCEDCAKCCEMLADKTLGDLSLSEGQYCRCGVGNISFNGMRCYASNMCEPETKRCLGTLQVETCQEDGKWKTIEECDEDACMECKDGACVSTCKENEVCDGEGTCEDLCEDVECLCGQCDPKTGKCNPPDEECGCNPPCASDEICVGPLLDADSKKITWECRKVCGDTVLGPCQECKTNPYFPDKKMPIYKCDTLCEECKNNECLPIDPMTPECCPVVGGEWID